MSSLFDCNILWESSCWIDLSSFSWRDTAGGRLKFWFREDTGIQQTKTHTQKKVHFKLIIILQNTSRLKLSWTPFFKSKIKLQDLDKGKNQVEILFLLMWSSELIAVGKTKNMVFCSVKQVPTPKLIHAKNIDFLLFFIRNILIFSCLLSCFIFLILAFGKT